MSSNIVLIGFMGTGKSAVGRSLSRRIPGRFRDTDCELERAFEMPIPDIFLKHGEDAFRSAETGILTKFADGIQNNRRCDRPLVLSTGGGTALRKENGLLLRRIGIVVCLVTTPETICKRVSKHVEQRPLLAPYRNALLPRIVQLLDERMPRYEQVANIVVNTARFRQPFEVADHIMTLTDDLEEQCAQVS